MHETIFPISTQHPLDFAAAIDALDRGASPAGRLRAAAEIFHQWGFGHVQIVMRDVNMTPQHFVAAGSRDPDSAPDALQALPGVIWRQRLPLLVPFREGNWYLLPGSDAWVAREFWASAPTPRQAPGEWGPLDLIVSLLEGANKEILGTLILADASAERRPDRQRPLEMFALLRHLGALLSHDLLLALAQRRAARLQRLQEAGAALARTLDEREVVRELARQVSRATDADGVMVAAPDLAADSSRTLARMVGAIERPSGMLRPLGDGVIAEVARTGRSVRSGAPSTRGDAEPWSPLAALDVMGDTVSEFGPPGSVLAVPVMSGIRLLAVVAVHATASDRFTAEDEEVVATMASQAATALANAQRYAESERERRQTEALSEVARAVGESLRPGEVLHLILRHAVALLEAQGACIALRQGDWLHIVAGTGAADLFSGVHVPVTGSLLGRVASEGAVVRSNDLSAETDAYLPLQRIAPIHNTVMAPLATARGIIGAIAVINRETPFTDDDVRILQRLGDQVSVAIVNARLFDEVERATREWKTAFDTVATGLAVLDDGRRITRCNKRFVELCGREHVSEVLGANLISVLLGDSVLAAEDDVIARASREGQVVRGEVRHARRGRVFSLTASPHPDGGTMVTVDDITDGQRLAERFQRVVETALDAIMITDTDRRVAFANPAARALFARSESLIGVPASDLVAPESRAEVARRGAQALLGEAQRYECFVIRADGARRRVEVSTAPLHEVGAITGTVACLRDITDESGNGSALVATESRYTRLVESASDAIFTIDAQGCFTSVNRALESACGVARTHLINKRCLGIVDPRDRVLAEDTIRRTLLGERVQVQLRYPAADGRIKIGSLNVTPIEEDGVVVGGLGIMRQVGDERLGTQ